MDFLFKLRVTPGNYMVNAISIYIHVFHKISRLNKIHQFHSFEIDTNASSHEESLRDVKARIHTFSA